MRPTYLGKILIRWCDSCHCPVLSRECACGTKTREVPVTPPGDVRPAFPADIARINELFSSHFGVPLIPAGHLALLNKVPDPDRMDEVVVGGGVVASIRYIPAEDRWEPIPRSEAGVLMRPARRFVVADDGAVPSIRGDGASLLAPGLVAIDPAVRAGDEVFILSREGDVVGVGRAKVDAGTASSMERGSVVRTRRNVTSICVPGGASWNDAVTANRDVLARAEEEAVSFIRLVAAEHTLQKNISYSGGKDSLAVLLLVRKALGGLPLLFADTGLEFPETYQNVDEVSLRYGMPVVRSDGNARFWERFDLEGPPAVNNRWCCRTCKLTPIAGLIQEKWGECLSFIGQRRYESVRRKNSGRVWRNVHIPCQVSAAPIQNWTALHVWLYIFQEGAPYNALYTRGLDRIGCFMCPSSDIAVFGMIREMHPLLWAGWEEKLEEHRQSRNYPPEWVTGGQWRMRENHARQEDGNR